MNSATGDSCGATPRRGVQDDVDDSYAGIVADIGKLQDKKRIYAVYNNDLRTTVLYARHAAAAAAAAVAPPASTRQILTRLPHGQLARLVGRADCQAPCKGTSLRFLLHRVARN